MTKRNITFMDVFCELNKAHDYERAYDLDYLSGDDDAEPMPYDDFYAITRFGGSEGIYVDFYVEREEDSSKEHIATAKTLIEDDSHFIKMHELAAKVVLELIRLQALRHGLNL